MSWIKQVFTDFQTVITAKFLNDLQDQIIQDETTMGGLVTGVKGNSEASYRSGNVNITKANVGLGNVDNTSDAQKPVSNATQEMLDSKVDKVTGKGLSTNDYTNAEKQRVADSALQTDLDALDDRVDQIYNGGVLYDTASGSVASFSDGADNMPIKKLVAQIEPVQDLHGYSNPWPAGGGKNLFDEVYDNIPIGSAPRYKAIYVGDGDYTLSTTTPLNTGGNTNLFLLSGNVSSGENSGVNGVSTGNAKTVTASDGYVTIAYRNYMEANPQEYKTQLEKGSTATDYAPYSNICPISGHTGAEVTRTGKNLLDVDSISAIKSTQSNTRNGVYITKPGTYTIKAHDSYSNTQLSARIKSKSGVYDSATIFVASGTPQPSVTYTIEDGDTLIIFDANPGSSLSTSKTMFRNTKVQLELGSTATDYEECRGSQISVTFPSEAGDSGTVYGGTLTINPDRTGTLVVDKASADLGAMTWSNNGDYWYNSSLVSVMKMNGYSEYSPIISEKYETSYPSRIISKAKTNIIANYTAALGGVLVYTGDNTTAPSGQLVYELVSPQTYQLTAEQVSGILTTLYGTNNIWANTGNTEVTYPADTKLYIDGKLAELQATILENIGG